MRIAVAGGTGRSGTPTVDAARRRGHEVVVLSRAAGVNLLTGTGLREALEGVDVVIDASGAPGADDPGAFHETVGRTLRAAEHDVGVRHHVVLSIVGCDRIDYPLYRAKTAQERIAAGSGVPFTIARTTQFHEFSGQIWRRGRMGPLRLAPVMRTRPVSVREVGEHLVSFAEGDPAGRAAELCGPREESLVSMVRSYARAIGDRSPVLPMRMRGDFGRAQRDGRMLPAGEPLTGTQSFAEWVAELRSSR